MTRRPARFPAGSRSTSGPPSPDGQDRTVEALKADIRNLRGRIATESVRTTHPGHVIHGEEAQDAVTRPAPPIRACRGVRPAGLRRGAARGVSTASRG